MSTDKAVNDDGWEEQGVLQHDIMSFIVVSLVGDGTHNNCLYYYTRQQYKIHNLRILNNYGDHSPKNHSCGNNHYNRLLRLNIKWPSSNQHLYE